MQLRTKLVALSFLVGPAILGAQAASESSAPTAKERKESKSDAPAADNTGRNVRDRDKAAPTADDQTNAKQDRELAAAVRKAVVDDKSLSTSAHNVKIVSRAGMVTLRGPVNSSEEKQKVGDLATAVAGVNDVKNNLEVKTK